MSRPVTLDGVTVEIGITVGVAALRSGSQADRVVTAAAEAMGAAKRRSR